MEAATGSISRWHPSRLTLFSLAVGGSLVTALVWLWRTRSPSSDSNSSKCHPSGKSTSAGTGGNHGSSRHVDSSGDVDHFTISRNTSKSYRAPSISSRTSTLRGSRRGDLTEDTLLSSSVEENAIISQADCGRLGLQALHNVIDQLEQALHRFRQFETANLPEATTPSDSESMFVMRELQALLEQAYSVREGYKQKLILQAEDYVPSDESDSETESFVSAAEFIDISDLDDQLTASSQSATNLMYRAALLELDNGNIHYRSVRTRMVGCETDTEYLAKLHCLRLAFDHILADKKRRAWMKNSGREMMSRLLNSLGYNQAGFEEAFKTMMDYLENLTDPTTMNEELEARGVKVSNFFDIVFDMVLLDSFQDLSNPPSSLVSVINNRWLTNGFKKTALDSVVWTILLTKRKLLKNQEGFIAYFYSIVATIAPALAWGFLGPDIKANNMCETFKDNLVNYVTDIFSSQKVNFTNVEELSDNVFVLSQNLEKRLLPILNEAIVQ